MKKLMKSHIGIIKQSLFPWRILLLLWGFFLLTSLSFAQQNCIIISNIAGSGGPTDAIITLHDLQTFKATGGINKDGGNESNYQWSISSPCGNLSDNGDTTADVTGVSASSNLNDITITAKDSLGNWGTLKITVIEVDFSSIISNTPGYSRWFYNTDDNQYASNISIPTADAQVTPAPAAQYVIVWLKQGICASWNSTFSDSGSVPGSEPPTIEFMENSTLTQQVSTGVVATTGVDQPGPVYTNAQLLRLDDLTTSFQAYDYLLFTLSDDGTHPNGISDTITLGKNYWYWDGLWDIVAGSTDNGIQAVDGWPTSEVPTTPDAG